MVENPQYGEIYNSNSSIALACKLPMPGGIRGAVPPTRWPPRLHETPYGNHAAGLLTLISGALGACLSKRDKIRMPYVGQAAGTWFSRAHALLKNRKTGGASDLFLEQSVGSAKPCSRSLSHVRHPGLHSLAEACPTRAADQGQQARSTVHMGRLTQPRRPTATSTAPLIPPGIGSLHASAKEELEL